MSLVRSLSQHIGVHSGRKIVVCGCGQSVLSFVEHANSFITIGVNDIPSLFEPTYLFVTDHPGRFRGPRKDTINRSRSKHLFTCVKGWRHHSIVYFELGNKELKNLDSHTRIDHFVNSPYAAVSLAYKMGAKHIGLIGVDFTPGHFYRPNDGEHPVVSSGHLNRVIRAYDDLGKALNNRGVTLHNLSDTSRLNLPRLTIKEFDKL